jgi:hypothetical protein
MQHYKKVPVSFFSQRYLHAEGSSFAGLAFGPYASAHAFDRFLCHGQTDACAGVPFGMLEAMEYDFRLMMVPPPLAIVAIAPGIVAPLKIALDAI